MCQDGIWDAVTIEKGNKTVAVLPYYLKKKGIFSYITMPPLCKMLGPYILPFYKTDKHYYKICQQLIAGLPKVDYFYQNFYYHITNWLPFYWNGFRQTTAYSYTIDLCGLEIVYKNIYNRYRNIIKNTCDNLLIKQEDDLKSFYNVNKKTFRHKKMAMPYTFDFLSKYNAILKAKKARKIFFATDKKGNIHSTVYLIWDASAAYYIMAGNAPEFRKSGAGTILIWEAIRYAAEELQLSTFDFEGSMIPDIERIFRRFGGIPQAYFSIEKYYSTLFKIIQSIRK